MLTSPIITSIKKIGQRLNQQAIEKDLNCYRQILYEIKKYAGTFPEKTDSQLKEISGYLSLRTRREGSLDDLLIEAYALVTEVVQRVLGIKPFDIQIIGGIVLHQGKLAEMQTGEGKTLTAVFPAYLNALSGKGVHVLTFNDYLARRDARWMEPIYQFLGLTVGYVREGLSPGERQKAYCSDVTYLTAKEAGFDYLRDSLCYQPGEGVQRPFHLVIIDEADSILIDEARIPLIIAGSADEFITQTCRLADMVRKLIPGSDVEFHDSERNVYLTDSGLERVEKLLSCGDLYALENTEILNQVNCALHAEFLMHRDVDYIVRNGKIELVDEFTGRVADKRRWPDGLQTALEAKENIQSRTHGRVLNSITLQNFLQLYPKICGMTATALSAEEEFRQFYNLGILVIPPHRPCVRIDHKDQVFRTKAEKHRAIIAEIIKVHRTKRPILVGTRSVAESAELARTLQEQGVGCTVLNAKNDEYEAGIIARAGKIEAVTISTNMAGRGTDIRLGGDDEAEKEQVLALGGLYVIGTNRHESQRIDHQLRGRAGRQGDPGSSRFFISLEDDLFVRYRLTDLLPSAILTDHPLGEIDNRVLGGEINRLQRIIEGQNLEIKKTLFKYSDTIDQQRRVLFDIRWEWLNAQSALDFFISRSPEKLAAYRSQIDENYLKAMSQKILLHCLDASWSHYLAHMAEIREGIHLQRLGGLDPFFEFQKLAVTGFSNLIKEIEKKAVDLFNALRITGQDILLEGPPLKRPSATWTYLINDDPFDNLPGLKLIRNIGFSSGAGLIYNWPFLFLFLLTRKLKKQTDEDRCRLF
ncbi:MAG: accessory Sec system translocase SecA2 [Deltaproteobacteria bacterium]|nr:accessory Sec system translocase SecA2 [Deltaproteobacteria bacterium]